MAEITDNLDAEILANVRQALNGEITTIEAMQRIRRAQRLAAIERYRVPIKTYGTADLDVISRRLGLKL